MRGHLVEPGKIGFLLRQTIIMLDELGLGRTVTLPCSDTALKHHLFALGFERGKCLGPRRLTQ